MYRHVCGPKKGGLFVSGELNPKLQTPKRRVSKVLASDGFIDFMADGSRKRTKPLYYLKKMRGMT